MDFKGVLQQLQVERTVVSARLDTIDLAIANLTRLSAIDQVDCDHVDNAASRRDLLFTAIKAEARGLTLKELRKRFSNMNGKARSNTLQSLRRLKQIKRSNGRWVATS